MAQDLIRLFHLPDRAISEPGEFVAGFIVTPLNPRLTRRFGDAFLQTMDDRYPLIAVKGALPTQGPSGLLMLFMDCAAKSAIRPIITGILDDKEFPTTQIKWLPHAFRK